MRAASILFLVVFFSSCSIFSEGELVSFSMPHRARWVFRDSTENPEDEKLLTKESDYIALYAMKGGVTAIIAKEDTGGDYVYGAIYPYETALTEEGFFSAYLVLYLYEDEASWKTVNTFNWARLTECVRELGEDGRKALDDADAERMAEKVKSGKGFSKRDVKHKESN